MFLPFSHVEHPLFNPVPAEVYLSLQIEAEIIGRHNKSITTSTINIKQSSPHSQFPFFFTSSSLPRENSSFDDLRLLKSLASASFKCF
jgi:hypothetical protein